MSTHPEPPDRLASLRRRRDRLQLLHEVSTLKSQVQRDRDQSAALEAWNRFEVVDPRRWRTDSHGRPYESLAHLPPQSNPSTQPHDLDQAAVRRLARWASSDHCAGAGVRNSLINYTVGRGFRFAVGSKRTGAAPPPGLINAVQDAVDEFLDDHDWTGDFDRELFWRWRRDGEFFLALYPGPNGKTSARVVEPEQIVAPRQTPFSPEHLFARHGVRCQPDDDWSHGVHTAQLDVQRIHGYCVQWEPNAPFDYLPAEWMEHARANVDRNVKRGLSDFHPAWQWLARQETLLRNTAEGAAVQAAIAFIRQHGPGVGRASVEQFRSAESDPPLRSSNPRPYSRTYESGSILDIPRGMEYRPGPLGAERGPVFIDVAQAVLRHVGVRWSMPEYLITGDSGNANYASSLVAESPFVKTIESLQTGFKTRCSRILWKVLRTASRFGRFARFGEAGSYSGLLRWIDLQIDPPPVTPRDPERETRRRQILFESGLLSPATWAAQEGLDFTLEQSLSQQPFAQKQPV